jgi:hypothetical protein
VRHSEGAILDRSCGTYRSRRHAMPRELCSTRTFS